MFAVIETGGKQYRVKKDSIIDVEKLAGDVGQALEIEKVLMISDQDDVKVGSPYLEGAKVTATIMDQGRGKKIRVFKMKRRKRYRKTIGHRQYITKIKVDDILLG